MPQTTYLIMVQHPMHDIWCESLELRLLRQSQGLQKTCVQFLHAAPKALRHSHELATGPTLFFSHESSASQSVILVCRLMKRDKLKSQCKWRILHERPSVLMDPDKSNHYLRSRILVVFPSTVLYSLHTIPVLGPCLFATQLGNPIHLWSGCCCFLLQHVFAGKKIDTWSPRTNCDTLTIMHGRIIYGTLDEGLKKYPLANRRRVNLACILQDDQHRVCIARTSWQIIHWTVTCGGHWSMPMDTTCLRPMINRQCPPTKVSAVLTTRINPQSSQIWR
ncbi:uncharacterized protein BJ212DRAFT_30262 [Suillus subaureus]|uniref:Uncharacterized protein n=1 Tax=Suillus subaureus TaxID=48587 RepID=A0A9P7JK06_9AGAM|nr:uncharacterized protein BJ212DRAFT_30262 [Suillus subaureus]KAG1827096.1 hypothetical protein BJ212DRAFT_30262 [Suillus subaureus]